MLLRELKEARKVIKIIADSGYAHGPFYVVSIHDDGVMVKYHKEIDFGVEFEIETTGTIGGWEVEIVNVVYKGCDIVYSCEHDHTVRRSL